IINDVRIRAHLWPFLSSVIISCFVMRLMNHSWRVESRLVTHRLLGEGRSRAGNEGLRGIVALVGVLHLMMGFLFIWSLVWGGSGL
uniref:Uncharacterized protein n=1 Tax=Cyanistes caeruleus TaxID=156563 RepID=A0A8C0VPT1_CYACU